uniref:Uncharacterized protein n=1 Tax=Arundo donax TaxID=35708 RepID=A0A0A8ZM90_ARUDO
MSGNNTKYYISTSNQPPLCLNINIKRHGLPSILHPPTFFKN